MQFFILINKWNRWVVVNDWDEEINTFATELLKKKTDPMHIWQSLFLKIELDMTTLDDNSITNTGLFDPSL